MPRLFFPGEEDEEVMTVDEAFRVGLGLGKEERWEPVEAFSVDTLTCGGSGFLVVEEDLCMANCWHVASNQSPVIGVHFCFGPCTNPNLFCQRHQCVASNDTSDQIVIASNVASNK